jgi:hypothetical protein
VQTVKHLGRNDVELCTEGRPNIVGSIIHPSANCLALNQGRQPLLTARH